MIIAVEGELKAVAILPVFTPLTPTTHSQGSSWSRAAGVRETAGYLTWNPVVFHDFCNVRIAFIVYNNHILNIECVINTQLCDSGEQPAALSR